MRKKNPEAFREASFCFFNSGTNTKGKPVCVFNVGVVMFGCLLVIIQKKKAGTNVNMFIMCEVQKKTKSLFSFSLSL